LRSYRSRCCSQVLPAWKTPLPVQGYITTPYRQFYPYITFPTLTCLWCVDHSCSDCQQHTYITFGRAPVLITFFTALLFSCLPVPHDYLTTGRPLHAHIARHTLLPLLFGGGCPATFVPVRAYLPALTYTPPCALFCLHASNILPACRVPYRYAKRVCWPVCYLTLLRFSGYAFCWTITA